MRDDNVNTVAGCLILLWWGFCLSLIGLGLFVAWHFIAKVW